MKKRLGMAIGLLLAVFMAAILVVPECRLIISGYLRGENHFKGRPTSYWRYEVEKYTSWCEHPTRRGKSLWDKLFFWFSKGVQKPDVLWGDQRAIPVLIDLTRERTHRSVFVAAYNTLSTLGPGARIAIPSLKEDLQDEDIFRSTYALVVLRHMGPEGVQILIGALKDDRPQIRTQAAGDLGRVEPRVREAIPALVEALQDEDEGVRTWSAIALMAIDPEEAKKVGAEKFIPAPSSGMAATP